MKTYIVIVHQPIVPWYRRTVTILDVLCFGGGWFIAPFVLIFLKPFFNAL